MDAYYNFLEQETKESFDVFKATFIKNYSEKEWDMAILFFKEFGGATLCDFVY